MSRAVLRLAHTKDSPPPPISVSPSVLCEAEEIARHQGSNISDVLRFFLSAGARASRESRESRLRRERKRLLDEIEAHGGFDGPVRDEQRDLSRALDAIDAEIGP